VPIAAGSLGGMDALLAISQMPGGVPVATMGIGKAGAKNAAYHCARMLAPFDADIKTRMEAVLAADKEKVMKASLPTEY
jgi:phosphoribosylcarboxyaminoimidazole (NCAIR) mutase